jgi:hypothetical protein
MKTLAATLIAIGLLTGAAQARVGHGYFTDLALTAPHTVFDDIQDSAPRSPFDQIRDSAPRAPFDGIRDSAPHAPSGGSSSPLDLPGE